MYTPKKGHLVICITYSLRGSIGPMYSEPYETAQEARNALALLSACEKDRIYGQRVVTLGYEHYKIVGPRRIVGTLL